MTKFKAGDIVRYSGIYRDYYFLITSEEIEHYNWTPLSDTAKGSKMTLFKRDQDMFVKVG